MDQALLVRAFALYGPMALALGLAMWCRPSRRVGAALLLGVLWMLPALLLLQVVNRRTGWWVFITQGPSLLGLPVELYLGWCCLWGAVPVFALRRWSVGSAAVGMVALDLVAMPLCSSVVRLGPQWLVGEAVAAAVVLLPCLLLAQWTISGRRVGTRGAMQALIAGGIFLFVLPESIFAVVRRPLGSALHGWHLSLALQAVAVLALPGVAAVQEFAERGGGTPIPYDPPPRLVVSGVYRYMANPMQMGCTVVLFAWGGVLGIAWMAVAAAMAWCYGVGLARWDEGSDLQARFGDAWVSYRAQVPDWWVRWRPCVTGQPALLYVSSQCGPCSEVARWFLARRPVGLVVVAAESFPGEPLRRMRYVPGDGAEAEDGVRAFARGLEHLNFGWAVAGAAMRLPGVRLGLQVLLDAVGFAEREPRRAASPS